MRRAFTAIELAVVLVLIAVLAVFILPLLDAGREAAVKTACLAGVRQVGYSFMMYQTERDSAWPWARQSVDAAHPHWPDPTGSLALLYPQYAPKAYLFRCPAREDQVVLNPDGKDFLNCENFHVSPEGTPMREEDRGKEAPVPPDYFYDCGSGSGPNIRPSARPNRVVYGDECVHNYWENEAGQGVWVGQNNHAGGGNFLFADKHVEWIDVQWTGVAWQKGQSKPFVPNPYLRRRFSPTEPGGSAVAQTGEWADRLDVNVFWAESDMAGSAHDADLAGMMWFDRRWNEF